MFYKTFLTSNLKKNLTFNLQLYNHISWHCTCANLEVNNLIWVPSRLGISTNEKANKLAVRLEPKERANMQRYTLYKQLLQYYPGPLSYLTIVRDLKI